MLAALEGMITELRQIGVPISLSERIDAVRSLNHLPLAERDAVKSALRAAHGAEKVQGQVSGYYLNLEIRSTYDGMMVAIPEKHWGIFRTLSVSEMASVLKELAGHLQFSRYQKHPRGPKKPPPKKRAYSNGGHVSTFKILNGNK